MGWLTRNRGNVTRWLYPCSSYEELAGGCWSVGRYAGGWRYIQWSTRNHENEGTTDNLRCMLYSVYAALSVNSWWWHGEIERDDLTLCSGNDGRVVDKKERDGGWRWEWYGGYEWTWEIRGTTCLIGLRRPRIGGITRWIGTHICCIGAGKLNRTRNSLKSQFLMMISPIIWQYEVESSLSISVGGRLWSC